MSRQVIVAGSPHQPSTTGTRYTSLMGGNYGWSPSDAFTRQKCPTYVNLHTLRVSLIVAPGEGKSYTFTVRRGTIATPLSVTISGTDTTGVDTSHAVAVTPGVTFLDIMCESSGTPDATWVRWSLISESVIPKETILIAGTPQNLDSTAVFYTLVGTTAYSATEFYREIVFPTAGTLKKLYVQSGVVAGAGNSFIYTVRKNSNDTGLTCTIAGTSGTGAFDITNTVAIAAGDTACLKIERAGGSPAECKHWWGVVFEPDTDGEFIIPMSGGDILTLVGTEFTQVTVGNAVWNGTVEEQLANAFTVKKIYVEMSGAPGAGNSFNFALLRNGAWIGLSCVISGANRACNSARDVSFADGDLLKSRLTTTIVGLPPRNLRGHLSYLGYIAPAPSRAVDFGANF